MFRARLTAPALACALAVLLLLGGCSSGGKSFVASTTVAPTPGSTLATTATTSRPTSGNPFCDFVATYQDRFGRVNPALADPAQLRPTMEEAAKSLKDAQGEAPDAIKADVGLLNEAFQRLLTGLQQANFDISRLPPATLLALAAPEFVAASGRLDAYMRQNCR